MFALSKIAVASASTIHLKDANGGKLYDEAENPVTITICSPGSPEFEKANDERLKRGVARHKRRGNRPLSGAEMRDDQNEWLADITVGASDNLALDEGGEPLKSRDDFIKLYSTSSLGFIKEQILSEVGDWGNFTGSSETI